MILGLFALSQAFTLIFSNRVIDGSETELSRKLLGGFLEILRYPKVLLRSAGFGVSMGVLPGVGEFLAQFFSYTTARAGSKEPEKFGRGAPEGIIASETANNAVPPAALVPLLALGIPGEAFTAMMLTVFIVHGVDPGPTLFEDHRGFVAGLYMSLVPDELHHCRRSSRRNPLDCQVGDHQRSTFGRHHHVPGDGGNILKQTIA